MKVIELKNLTKTYHLEKLDVPVLHGINLDIYRGEFVAIMGASGSGKSTLLNILGLLDKPSSGSFKLAGIEVSQYTDDELAALRNHYLGFIFQQFNLLSKLTAKENVSLPIIYANSKDEKKHEDAKKLLELVGLADRMDHRPNEMSGGQQQRVAIARSLINKPLIIFADEPTGNLDTKSTKEIIQILKDLNASGITIVMVTHEPELTAYATRTIKVQDGLIIADETAKKVEQTSGGSRANVYEQKTFSLSRIKDYFAQGFRSLVGNKMRSVLSILGVMIGVASLISMLAVGNGAQKAIAEQVEGLGSNLLMVMPGASQRGGISSESGARLRLIPEDIADLKKNVRGIEGISGYASARAQVVANGKNYNTRLDGVSVDYAKMRNSQVESGRFFTEAENLERQRVAVVGKTIIKQIWGAADVNPIGEYVKINRIDFQIIGVLPEKGSNGYRDEDDKIIVPLNTAIYRVIGTQYLSNLDVQVQENADMNAVADNITKRLLLTHRMPANAEDSVRVRNMAEIQEALSSMASSFSLLLGAIAFISLLVGGIGIMNIMFVSVSERTKEIGLRKAIGANNADILFQFIIESIFVCCAGGIIGIIFGSGVSILINQLADWTTSITAFSVILAFCFSAVTGLLFGVWPARKASLLNPIDALRHD
ncbi:ABC transporter permease [Endomicrobium proavitum]|uniref:Macrolide export ATP-binding/permease protein MacB n=1 Tax=Endomicrobium proavitum TaxID=1408281 RepID=A0A0G3WIP5_9BACT|nr:ABC transporter permease [Endomicrobium proavitum]AKL98511.1 Macrolide export ATP-binding/permease protein MacB [Endomicrobium proavitum]